MTRIHRIHDFVPAAKDGNPGKDSVVYYLVCSNLTPNVSDADVVVKVTAWKTTGEVQEKLELGADFFLEENGLFLDENPVELTMSKGSTTPVTVILRDSQNNYALAQVTINPVVNGVNGESVQVQYCPSKVLIIDMSSTPDTSRIHSTFQNGDEWMRTRSNASADWSSWFRIVGESGTDGEYVDYTFNLSKDKTIKNVYTSPANLINNSWTDAPKIPTDEYPYLWMRMKKMNLPAGQAVVVGREYTYVRLTGEDGKDGEPGKDGTSFVVQGKADYHVSSINEIDKTKSGRWLVDDASVPVREEDGPEDDRVITEPGADVGNAYILDNDIWVWTSGEYWQDLGQFVGPQGARGPKGDPGQSIIGPMSYYAGEWQRGISYTRTKNLVPLVTHGDDEFFYYPKNEETLLNLEPSSNSEYWEQEQRSQIVLARIIMALFGKIGSAIFADQFLISQYGKLNGATVDDNSSVKDTAYTNFNPKNPEDSTKFVPNLYLDFLKGVIYGVGAKFKDITVIGGNFENIVATGFMYCKPVEINDSNFNNYFSEQNLTEGKAKWNILRNGFINYKATGNRTIELRGMRSSSNLSETEKQTLRSMAGTKVRIYNTGTGQLSLTGELWPAGKRNYIQNQGDNFVSFGIQPGHYAVLEVVIDIDKNKREIIYWETYTGIIKS